jgi:FG-GAP repeat
VSLRRYSTEFIPTLLIASAIFASASPGARAFDCVQNELDKLTALDAEALNEFGRSVGVSGDVVVVGVSKNGDAGSFSGSAYVFRRSGAVWIQEQKLTASDAAAGDEFGFSVSVDGGVVVVGARMDDGVGSAYVFRFDGVVWVEEQKLSASDAAAGDEFGHSVSVSGDTIVVGASQPAGAGAGAVYVYRDNAGVWSQEQKVTAADAAADDGFGISVSVDGNVVLVGAWRDDDACVADPNCNSGSAYLFRRTGVSWFEEDKIIAADGALRDGFGFSVSLSAGVAVVGARDDDDAGNSSGSAYVFRDAAGVWSQEQKLVAGDAAAADKFGASVGVSGQTIVVGATDDGDGGPRSGSGYVYRFDGLVWQETQKLVASDAAAGDRLGFSTSVDGDVAILSATQADLGALANAGAAYAFDLLETCPPTGCVPGDGTCDGACQLCDVDGTCRHCRFDLDFDAVGVIGTGDFGIFSGCFGTVYLPGDANYDACLPANFDGDIDGATGQYIVGTSDFGLFSGCFGMACGACGTCFP